MDTGFTDYVTLPSAAISQMQLEATDTRYFVLGDGEPVEFPLYSAVVEWDGGEREILIVEADDDPLIGMELLEGFTLFIDAREGGEVRIERRT